ncbi:MAG: AAA family ATPase [Deltaproteobacteria bacterium]|nr:AAA family ATPase [Deltaproteobacteria bacterium]
MKNSASSLPERKKTKLFDPIGTIARHWMEIAVFGTIIFILTIPCSLFISEPFYTVEGRIMVAPALNTFIIRNEETPITGYYNAYVRTHVNRIQDLDIVEKAIDRLDPEFRSTFVPEDVSLSIAASNLLRRLQILHMTGTHLITLKLDDKNPYGMAELINNIIEIYMEKIQNEGEGKDYRRLMYLQNEKDKLEEGIIAQTRLSQEIAKETGTFSFKTADNIYNTQFESIQEEYIQAYSARVEKETMLNAYIQQKEALTKISIDPLVEEFLMQSTSTQQLYARTYQELQDLHALLSTYTLDNPDRDKLETRIRTIEETLQQLKDNEKIKAAYIISEKRSLGLEEKIISARAEYTAAKMAEDELLTKRDEILAKRSMISQKILSGKQIDERLEHMRNLLNKIDERISDLTLESKSSGRLQIESYAKIPQRPSGSNFKKLFVLFFLLAYGIVVMICVGFDIFDKRIRDRKDIFHGLGSHPTWPISNYRFTGKGIVPFSRVTLDDSSNVVAKAIQSLSIRIDKERKEHHSQCALFTGIDNTCGTTEILLNTAYAFTKLCSKILVIDAQFDHPCIETITRTGTTKSGLIDFLHNKADIKDCIVHDYERCIDYILPGHTPSPGELASLDLSTFPQMLGELKKEYSFIFIDASPILSSDITEYLALQSDMVITVIQGDKSLYEDLYMAGDILFRLEIQAIAAVLNWGAPRNLNSGQILISRILWPVEKLLAKIMRKDLKYVKYFL